MFCRPLITAVAEKLSANHQPITTVFSLHQPQSHPKAAMTSFCGPTAEPQQSHRDARHLQITRVLVFSDGLSGPEKDRNDSKFL